jgi:polysaccharide biosynthesis/export protein
MNLNKVIISSLAFTLLSLQALAFTPSAAQIEQFKKLPRAQQEALAKQYGVDLSSITGASSGATPVDNPEVVKPIKKDETDQVQQIAEEKIEDNAEEQSESIDKTEDVEARVVKEELKQFGYQLFEGAPTTFAPASDIPVPTDYVIGPGDTVKIQLFGKTSGSHEVAVTRDGMLTLPELDIISVIGLSFKELKEVIQNEYQGKAIGIRPIVTLGALRSIRIFVLGEANNPGAYTVSSLSSITHALFVSGGISKIGSLRNIQLKRQGKVVTTFDWYDLLLKGDTSKDQRLQPQDVIFVPSIGDTVGIRGEVKRSAIYELKKDERIADLLKMAGGLTSKAFPSVSRIDRINNDGSRVVVDLDLSSSTELNKKTFDGDIIEVFSILDRVENIINLSGHVQRPGVYAWRPGIRVTDLISNADELLPKADLYYSLVVREQLPNREIYVKNFSLEKALANPKSEFDIKLSPRDKLHIFGIETDRATLVEPIVNKLIAQERANAPAKIVNVTGNVRHPGDYPWHRGMTVQDLLTSSFETKSETDLDYAIIERTLHNKGRFEAITIDLKQDRFLNFKLYEEDKLYVFDLNSDRAELLSDVIEKLSNQIDKDNRATFVSIFGDVKFPGLYPLSKGMGVKELVAAAGGFLESAYTKNAEITRFETDLNTSAFKEHQLLNLESILAGNSEFRLQPKDVLSIRKIPDWRDEQFVTLNGEFVFPGRYEIKDGDTLSQVIERAGGFTSFAEPRAFRFSRESLKEKEERQLQFLKQKLKEDLTEKSIESINAQSGSGATEASKLSAIFDQMDNRLVKGRMAVNLEKVMKSSEHDVKLKNGDELFIPKIMQEVSVIGQVQQATSHVFDRSFELDDYITRSGGLTKSADDSRIYVIKANGEVMAQGGNLWFSHDGEIEPGDTIVVPLDTDTVDGLTLWTSVSQVIYQFGLAAAAINSL